MTSLLREYLLRPLFVIFLLVRQCWCRSGRVQKGNLQSDAQFANICDGMVIWSFWYITAGLISAQCTLFAERTYGMPSEISPQMQQLTKAVIMTLFIGLCMWYCALAMGANKKRPTVQQCDLFFPILRFGVYLRLYNDCPISWGLCENAIFTCLWVVYDTPLGFITTLIMADVICKINDDLVTYSGILYFILKFY